jgi:hypothetical protein
MDPNNPRRIVKTENDSEPSVQRDGARAETILHFLVEEALAAEQGVAGPRCAVCGVCLTLQTCALRSSRLVCRACVARSRL